MNQVLLTLSVPPSQADILTDWLLERGFPGFTSWQAWGHSNRTDHLTISEQIQGKQKRGMISLHLLESEYAQVVEQLQLEFQGFDIHYWVQPLMTSGSFNCQGRYQV
jgi:hypothetical protein